MRLLRFLVVTAFVLAAAPGTAHAHIKLVTATPAAGDSIVASPDRLSLLFSAHIEVAYTSLNLIAPNGQLVAIGAIEFAPGSDRQFSVKIPPLSMPGSYTVRWRTAGADGHVLEGSYTFVLLADTAAPVPADTAPVPIPSAETGGGHEHGGPSSDATGISDVAARWLHFTALILLLGALATRTLLLPRLDLVSGAREAAVRAVWRAAAFAAVALIGAAIARLWVQSVTLHGPDRAWSTPLLSIMLKDTSWGRAWLMQAVGFAVLGAGIAWARPRRDAFALMIAVPAALWLAAIPGLTGHAADAGVFNVVNDAAHIAASGTWLGTLAILAFAGLPAMVRAQPGARNTADAVAAFSPIALVAAAVVVATGVMNALPHFESLAQLTSTGYGRTLLIKVALVLCVIIAGFVNWRVVRPTLLGDADDLRRLRLSMLTEIAFAATVLIATAYLTGVQRP